MSGDAVLRPSRVRSRLDGFADHWLDRVKVVGLGAAIPLAVLAFWQWEVPRLVPGYLFPSPEGCVTAARVYFFGSLAIGPFDGTFLSDLTASAARVFGGFGLGVLFGVFVGALIATVPVVKSLLSPALGLLRSVPGICWLPLALLWFGFGTESALFLVFLGSFYPILLSTASGMSLVDRDVVRAARTLGADRPALLRLVVVPAAMPSILNGLRIGLAYSWIYMILAEFEGVNYGLGARLWLARQDADTAIIIVLMVIIGLLGVLSDIPIQFVLGRLFRVHVR